MDPLVELLLIVVPTSLTGIICAQGGISQQCVEGGSRFSQKRDIRLKEKKWLTDVLK